MKTNKSLVIAAIVVALFILSQFAAELCFLAGPKPERGWNFEEPGLDFKALSLSSHILTNSAFAMLAAGTEGSSAKVAKASMSLLRQALRRNPLDYEARYYLAKAYLQFSAMDNDWFNLGVLELKRAAHIRGSNKQIALDCCKVFFSLWPLLEDQDKSFAFNLLSTVMPTLTWPEFNPLVEMWSLYIQDAKLLMELLKRKPEFLGPTADQLVAAAIPIEQRHELLAMHEVHAVDFLERRFNGLRMQRKIGLEDSMSLLGQMRRLKGYHRLQPGIGFDAEKQAKLQRVLLLQVISGLLSNAMVFDDQTMASQVMELIQFYIANNSGLNALDDLQKLLEEKNYFKENDFSSLYLKTLIAYKKGNYSDIIHEIEALRKNISFVKKQQTADFTNILLLLVDSYYSSKLMIVAEAVATEISQNQPDNPDILYRILRILNILGSEDPQDPALKEKLLVVQNSRFITVPKPKVSFDVFLFNLPSIEIALEPGMIAALKPKQLLQVFVDGKIAFESYADELPEKIVIGPPFVEIESKVKVQITVI